MIDYPIGYKLFIPGDKYYKQKGQVESLTLPRIGETIDFFNEEGLRESYIVREVVRNLGAINSEDFGKEKVPSVFTDYPNQFKEMKKRLNRRNNG